MDIARAPTRIVAGPFNRVEGDLEVLLDVVDERVVEARVSAPMYRGFEQILLGKAPRDALTIVPRICGICSVTQSMAAATALAALAGVEPPFNGRLAAQLMLATENLADHLTHFYLFFMPDFCRAEYAGQPWHAEARRRFAPASGEHTRSAVAARQRWMTLMGTLGGKWPHTMSLEPGGTARAIDSGERTRLLARVREFRAFLQQQFIGDRLEAFAAIGSVAALWRWVDSDAGSGDLRFFLRRVRELRLDRLGIGPPRFLSHGAYRSDGDALLWPAGVWNAAAQQREPFDPADVAEDLSHGWYAASPAQHPMAGDTSPQADKPGAYTWAKAPRLGGQVIETGALARQLVAAPGLLREAVGRGGGSVFTRLLARALELCQVLPEMERWLLALRPGDPWCHEAALPRQGRAAGLVEAARGALGHWVRVDEGRIVGYQIVSPTTWNFSPRDEQGQAGALEQALAGLPVPQPGDVPAAVHHVVRSFDPCMVCTVH